MDGQQKGGAAQRRGGAPWAGQTITSVHGKVTCVTYIGLIALVQVGSNMGSNSADVAYPQLQVVRRPELSHSSVPARPHHRHAMTVA